MGIDRYRSFLKKLLPPGFAFTRGSGTQMDALLSGMAEEPAHIDDRAGDLLFEMFPDTTTELLTEWETVWGLPDPCAGALDTLSDRRAALLARMVHVGQQAPGFFVRVAATLGYTITVEENVDGSPYVWRVISSIITAPVYARAGSARAGDPIRTWGADMLECAMRVLNPAHLQLLVGYIEADIAPALASATIWPNGVTVALVFNQALSHGSSYSDADFSIDASLGGNGLSLSYVSGNGTATHLYTISGLFLVGETVSLDFSGDDESLVRADAAYLEAFAGFAIQNNSEQTEAAPSIVSATIGPSGKGLTLVFSEAMTQGSGYLDTDFNLDASSGGTDVGLTYVSGSGTDTWVLTIAKVIRKDEPVDLDYIGRVDGVEDSAGNDLAAVYGVTVVNGSDEDFADIVFWAGFEGGITGSTYLGTENDYPANHTGQITAYVYDSGAYKKTGLKSLWVNSSNSNTAKIVFALPTPVQEAAGRVGFWVRMGTVYKDFFGLKNSEWVGSDYPVLRFSHYNGNIVYLSRGYFGGPAKLEHDPYTFLGTVPSAILGTWVFYEVAWDYYSFGTKILANGQLISAASYTPKWPWTRSYDRVIIGADTSNGCMNYYDNFIISTDPTRDLYALALLESCPRV